MAKRRAKEKRKTIKELEKKLIHDENTWLKSLGEIADIARMILDLREEISKLQLRVHVLESKA